MSSMKPNDFPLPTHHGGHRGSGILHVAMALVVKAQQFLTFGENQKMLAEAEALPVPV